MRKEYKELDVTEFKVSKNLVTVKWQDEKGDGKTSGLLSRKILD